MIKSHHLASALLLAFLAGCGNPQPTDTQERLITPVDFSCIEIKDAFWSPRLEKHVTATLPACIDQIEHQTGRIRNFENAAKGSGEHSGIFFDDSDVYKALEGIACSLVNHPDPMLERTADRWIDAIAAAQRKDGYLNTYYTLTGLDGRWTNMDKHEMYCAGHLAEAAIAYYKATGKRKLLDVSLRMADHMMQIFGPGKRHWVAGHEEIELALVKLYEVTGERKYFDFAHWLLEERGHGHGSFGNGQEWMPAYYQDAVPVRDLTCITGHAVRSMYLFCAMADVAALDDSAGYVPALNRVWDDVVHTKMYITGGIGSSRHNEGFTEAYDLPNQEAYCETCASVGMVLWNARMNRLTGDAKYADVAERSLFNGALAGISLSGDRFFYVNPLASDGDHHRQAWYGCACCPSQISRFLPSVGNYLYGTSDGVVWVNQYIGSRAETGGGQERMVLTMATDYPWNGKITLTVDSPDRPMKKEFRLRIPGWCRNWSLTVNGRKAASPKIEKGYAVVAGKWRAGDSIGLELEMPVEVVAADPRVKENVGKRALQRGPLVYCLEEADNPAFEDLSLSSGMRFRERRDTIPGGITAIDADAGGSTLRFIPYYAWDNRAPGRMKVWVDYHD